MMSASSISAQIRAKKKKMEEAPMDATDHEVESHKAEADALSENTPSDAMTMNAESVDETAPNPKLDMAGAEGHEDEAGERKMKIKTMLRKMGK